MKFITLTAALLAATVATSAVANNYAPQAATAATAKTLRDDTTVTITGKIIRALGNEKYELQDRSGKIIVEIDNDEVPANIVGKTVTITGDVDVSKRSKRVKIDADHVQVH